MVIVEVSLSPPSPDASAASLLKLAGPLLAGRFSFSSMRFRLSGNSRAGTDGRIVTDVVRQHSAEHFLPMTVQVLPITGAMDRPNPRRSAKRRAGIEKPNAGTARDVTQAPAQHVTTRRNGRRRPAGRAFVVSLYDDMIRRRLVNRQRGRQVYGDDV